MKKKNLIVLLLIAVIGIVGVTIAYFSSTTTFENVFETLEYGTEYIEKFTSPDNWKPGDVTEKTLEVKNSGSVDEAVRVKVEESWVSKNGTTLLLKQGDNVAADIHWINEDDWTKVIVDGEDYYYYYYNYKLAPQETTSKLLDKVTFNPLINATTSCSDTVVDGVTTRTCNSSGAGYDGATYTLKFTIETVQYNKYQDAWNTSVDIAASKPEPTLTGAEYLLTNATNEANAEYNAETKGKMFYFTHILNEGTENEKVITETRYIGDEPNNYVYFNCDDMSNQTSSNCEVWRIIGVFDVERTDPSDSTKTIIETRLKIIRGSDFSTTMRWDDRDADGYESGNRKGKNDWNGAAINTYLNGQYYTSMSEIAKLQIEDAIYYLGGVKSNSQSVASFGTTADIYASERGTNVYSESPLNWEGKVALMYPSDMYMTYAKGVNYQCFINPSGCSKNNGQTVDPTRSWVHNTNKLQGNNEQQITWFLSPSLDSQTSVLYVRVFGSIGYIMAGNNYGVRPVVYLKSNIEIFDGDGTSENPYKLH